MSKVTPLMAPGGKRDLGKFHVKNFNLFEADELEAYEEIRTQANDRSSGITIEHIQQFTRKTTTVEGDGDNQIRTTTEDLYMMLQWWEKPVKPATESVEKSEAPREWSQEREVGAGDT